MASKMQSSLALVAVPMADADTTKIQSKFSNKTLSPFPLAAAHFDEMPDSGYVRAPVVLALLGISNSTLWRWVKSSRIPAPKTIGRSSLFQVGQLRACLENLQMSGQSCTTLEGK